MAACGCRLVVGLQIGGKGLQAGTKGLRLQTGHLDKPRHLRRRPGHWLGFGWLLLHPWNSPLPLPGGDIVRVLWLRFLLTVRSDGLRRLRWRLRWAVRERRPASLLTLVRHHNVPVREGGRRWRRRRRRRRRGEGHREVRRRRCLVQQRRRGRAISGIVEIREVGEMGDEDAVRAPQLAAALRLVARLQQLRARDLGDAPLQREVKFMRGGMLAHAQVRARLRHCDMGPAVGGRPLPWRHPAWQLHLGRITGWLGRPVPDVPVRDGGRRRRRRLARNITMRSPLSLLPSLVTDLDPRDARLSGWCTRTPGRLARVVTRLAQPATSALFFCHPWRQAVWRQVALRLADPEGIGGPPFRSPLEPIGRLRSRR